MNQINSFYKNYEFLDSGESRRLERFGQYLIDRPAQQAAYDKALDRYAWNRADLCFKDGVWLDNKEKEVRKNVSWDMEVSGVNFKLRLSKSGQVGIFPEQFVNWHWIYEVISEHLKKSGNKLYNNVNKFNVVNAFAYTGGASLFPAIAAKDFTSEICHVDGSKSAVNWAGENARNNGLTNIRWIVNDVLTFFWREARRHKLYEGIILDPPAFGRGGNKTWSMAKDIDALLEATKALISPAGPLFFVMSCHDVDLTSFALKGIISNALGIPVKFVETLELILPSVRGNPLPCGICARFKKASD